MRPRFLRSVKTSRSTHPLTAPGGVKDGGTFGISTLFYDTRSRPPFVRPSAYSSAASHQNTTRTCEKSALAKFLYKGAPVGVDFEFKYPRLVWCQRRSPFLFYHPNLEAGVTEGYPNSGN